MNSHTRLSEYFQIGFQLLNFEILTLETFEIGIVYMIFVFIGERLSKAWTPQRPTCPATRSKWKETIKRFTRSLPSTTKIRTSERRSRNISMKNQRTSYHLECG